ncbi:AzlD domain-containing protein [Helicobacter colisuis]|uniref:AzlD domain-containing protein n=1 Tax=Helicobacter colisuis TaxID=2949739 RepID=UPI002029D18C|nr:AzlD domain-containing protein [Helicobacter colisuis]MCL9822477.1 AzlD domain-containing protein [Helicobacter colisuis]
MQDNFDTFYLIGAILAATIGTALTRLLPFFIFKNATNNKLLKYLQDTMPLFIMTLLIFLVCLTLLGVKPMDFMNLVEFFLQFYVFYGLKIQFLVYLQELFFIFFLQGFFNG